ncbi:DUF2690 domain-containing protein [Streptomyces termitum]|uniref:DUF2690 domain-containing protein n=1 Tax=Streptomyces termitum TaxID=67368 RepID=UPI0033BFA92F
MTGGPRAAENAHDPRGAFFTEMRRIKDVSQLSYSRLADRTHYSRSSWERFLNGKQLPSRVAVEEFAAAARTDPSELLALLDLAVAREEASPQKQPVPEERPEAELRPPVETVGGSSAPVPDGPVPARRLTRIQIVTTAVGVVAGGLLGSLLTLSLVTPDGTPTAGANTAGANASGAKDSPAGSPAQPRPGKPVKVGCKSDTCMHREPQAEDCQWDATTVRQTFLRGMSIQLRYSEACQAVWGRIENGDVGDTVVIRDKRSSSDEATIRMEHDTYTRMLAVAPDATWETITVCGAIPSQKEQECSPLGSIGP